MLERLEIPEKFELQVSASVAVRHLNDRISRGEEILRNAGLVADDTFRREAQRWHDENVAVIDSIVRDSGNYGRVTSPGDDTKPGSPEQEFRQLQDDVNRELGQLSQLQLRISIAEGEDLV